MLLSLWSGWRMLPRKGPRAAGAVPLARDAPSRVEAMELAGAWDSLPETENEKWFFND